jgi:hypothetical protein
MEKDPYRADKHYKDSDTDDDEDEKKLSKKKKSSDTQLFSDYRIDEEKQEKKSRDTAKHELASFFRPEKSKKELYDNDSTKQNSSELPVDAEDEKPIKHEEPNLTEEEVHEATLAIIHARKQDVSEELDSVETGSPQECEALATAVFLENLEDAVEGTEVITKEALRRVFEESLADLALGTPYENTEQDVVPANSDNLSIPVKVGSPESKPEPDENLNPQSGNTGSTTTETYLSTLPLPPGSPAPSLAPTSGPAPYSYSSYSHNHISRMPTPSAIPLASHDAIVTNRNRRYDLLVGTVMGYIVGRRGGRKRAEKSITPEIDKLQKQVSLLHDAIVEKEVHIRQLARQKIEVSNTSSVFQQVSIIIEQRKTRKDAEQKRKRREELARNPGAEKIGIFSLPTLKVFHERRLPDGTENNPKRKQVEVMTEAELIEKIGDVRIQGVRIATMYQQKRLETAVFRRIVTEYLRGGPYTQTFKRELLPDPNEIDKKREQVQSAHGRDISSVTNMNGAVEREDTVGEPSQSKPAVRRSVSVATRKKAGMKSISGALVCIVAVVTLILLYLVF